MLACMSTTPSRRSSHIIPNENRTDERQGDADEFHHRRRQVDDPGLVRLLRRLVLGEHPHAGVEVDLGGRHPGDFRRPAAGFEHRPHELPELPVPDRREDLREFVRREDAGPPFDPFGLERPERVRGEDALLVGPAERPLDGDDRVPPAALPLRVVVEPAGGVERLEFGGREPAVGDAEGLEEILVVPDVSGLWCCSEWRRNRSQTKAAVILSGRGRFAGSAAMSL